VKKLDQPDSQAHTGGRQAKVLLVEDQAVVRLGVTQLIAQQPDLAVCAQAEDAPEAIGAIAASSPDVAVVDLTLKSSDGLELVKNIRAQYPKLPVLVLSGHSESIYAEQSLRAGAKGYVMKTEPLSQILTAIRRVLSGGVYLSEPMTAKMLEQQTRGPAAAETSPLQRLTDRERQVLHLIGQWHSTREIAGTLHLSIKTVEHYREKIKEKLNLTSASELVQYAVRWTQNPAPETPPGPEPDSDHG
jgi:DNA-binding NarL/FixJ family response regulator